MINKIPMICVVGPTASGKTSLSIDIAQKYGGEIVSADSMQIYKGIHIASAAPDEQEKNGIYKFDRSEKFDVAPIKEILSQKAEIED